jgi:hypothetical protein
MLHGVPIWPISEIPLAIQIWKWILMESVESASWRKLQSFVPVSISRPSVSKSTLKPKASARHVVLLSNPFIVLTQSQMARRLKFSVVGLPHYTIWHLYEPSVDDLRHMDEMEKEKQEKAKKEKEEKEKLEKISSQFDNPSGQWDKDKASLNFLANKDQEKQTGKTTPKQPAAKDGSPNEPKKEPKVDAKPVAADQK